VLQHETVTSAIIGASRVAQVEDGVRTLDKLELSPDELRAIDQALEASTGKVAASRK